MRFSRTRGGVATVLRSIAPGTSGHPGHFPFVKEITVPVRSTAATARRAFAACAGAALYWSAAFGGLGPAAAQAGAGGPDGGTPALGAGVAVPGAAKSGDISSGSSGAIENGGAGRQVERTLSDDKAGTTGSTQVR